MQNRYIIQLVERIQSRGGKLDNLGEAKRKQASTHARTHTRTRQDMDADV